MNKNFYFLIFGIITFFGIFLALPQREIKAVVFDFGGVMATADNVLIRAFLRDSFEIDKRELRAAFKELQIHINFGGTEEDFWKNYTSARGVELPADWFKQYEFILREAIKELPETIAIVKEIKSMGYITAMLSDITQFQAKIVRKMGYYDLVNPAILSFETGYDKPELEAYKAMMRKLNLIASEILFIDDRIENVKAAESLGIDAILFTSPVQLKKDLKKRSIIIKYGSS